MSDTPAPPITAIDVSDLLYYLARYSSVSGIQRVVGELLPLLVADRPETTILVAFVPKRREFVAIQSSRVVDLLQQLHLTTDDAGSRAKLAKLAKRVSAEAEDSRALVGSQVGVLLILGAAWTYPGLFGAVMALRNQGSKIITYLYDLIPAVTPGFPRNTADDFDEYLTYVAHLSDRVPCISQATRRDFETYCAQQNWYAPPGESTGLPPGLTPTSFATSEIGSQPAWGRPFVLFVGTIEARKNHLIALRAWHQLVATMGREAVPDLVCVGRIGWNAQDFLRELTESTVTAGRVHVLANGIADKTLFRLYRDCEFTIYPSGIEGWGLPVSESLAFGKPVITTDASSLPEAGGDAAIYVDADNTNQLHEAALRLLTDSRYRESAGAVAKASPQLSWASIVEAIWNEVAVASDRPTRDPVTLNPGTEYGLGTLTPYVGNTDGNEYLDFINFNRRLPLTGQVASPTRRALGRLAITGSPSSESNAGLRFAPGSSFTVQARSGVTGQSLLQLATARARGRVELLCSTPGQEPVDLSVKRGSSIDIPLTIDKATGIFSATIEVSQRFPQKAGLVVNSILLEAARAPDESLGRQLPSSPEALMRNGSLPDVEYPFVSIKSFQASTGYRVARFGWLAQRKIRRKLTGS